MLLQVPGVHISTVRTSHIRKKRIYIELTEEAYMKYHKRPKLVKQGHIYYVEFPVSIGSVQSGIRPAVVTSSNSRNKTSPTVTVAIITSRLKKLWLREHVLLPMIEGLPRQSMVVTEQQFTVDKDQLLWYRGRLSWNTWKKVHRALRINEHTEKEAYQGQ